MISSLQNSFKFFENLKDIKTLFTFYFRVNWQIPGVRLHRQARRRVRIRIDRPPLLGRQVLRPEAGLRMRDGVVKVARQIERNPTPVRRRTRLRLRPRGELGQVHRGTCGRVARLGRLEGDAEIEPARDGRNLSVSHEEVEN